MRTFAQVLLLIFYLIFFIILMFSSTLKYALLDYNYWTKSFEKHEVYLTLTNVVHESINSQVNSQGGNAKDVVVLTDLVTPENTKDFVNINLKNLFDFAKGNAPELKVYVPIKKLPNDLLPKSLINLNQQMTLKELSTRFNVTGLNNLPLNYISKLGFYNYYFFIGASVLAGLFLVMLVLSVSAGKKLIAPGIAILTSGLITIGLAELTRQLLVIMDQTISQKPNLNLILTRTILTPVVTDVLIIWTYFGVALCILGIITFFITKWGRLKNEKIPLN